MAGPIWALAELADGRPTRLSLELATLCAQLAATAGREAAVLALGVEADGPAAAELAAQGPAVLAGPAGLGADRPAAAVLSPLVAALVGERKPSFLLLPASVDGKDLAGALVALLDWPILVNAAAVRWSDDGPVAQMSTFGGRLVTESVLTEDHGLVLVRSGSVTAAVAASSGPIEDVTVAVEAAVVESAGQPAAVVVSQRVAESSAAASIEEARVVVAGGRGVAGPAGFAVIEDLAEAFGGAVGATRAVVDAGWYPYSQQIGQTGKIVKPALYVAAGISGAIQHKVGMQTSGTIVAINRDPDAPIAEFADLVVVGDLFEIAPRLAAALRARRG
ncbi:MAG: electron transfer flavoprotein subunit alpha/FixB family protein [Candidatus Limnocylindrales bacterium]